MNKLNNMFVRRELDKKSSFNLSFSISIFAVAICFTPNISSALDVKAARKTFKKCMTCHEIGEGAKNKFGPLLNGLQDKPLAAADGYKYSKAFQKAAPDIGEWNSETLNQFLKKPKKMIKGTKMGFSGLKKKDERANLIDWLLKFNASGMLQIENADNQMGNAAGSSELLGSTAVNLSGDPEYGEYLSGECVTCHKLDGSDEGIASIIKWPKENFIDALYQYKTGIRKNLVMQNVTKRLGDEEMAALAAYFGALPAK